jgi:hypothetical protein
MSSAFQTVVRGPSFCGFGKRPSRTPCHHVDLETGIGPTGAKMDDNRTKPVRGKMIKDMFVRLGARMSDANWARLENLWANSQTGLPNKFNQLI